MSIIHEYKATGFVGELKKALAATFSYPQTIKHHRYLLANFFTRDLFGRFKGSLLGVGWVMIHPVFLFLVYYLVFGYLFQTRAKEGQPQSWYPFYLFSGIITWMFFIETVSRSCTVVVENGNLIKKVSFPAELLPMPIVMVNAVIFCVGLLILYAVAVIWSLVDPGQCAIPWPGWELLAIIPLSLEISLFALGVGLFLATANVFMRDTHQVFNVLTLFWFFVSPIFWFREMFDPNGDNLFYRAVEPYIIANPAYFYILGIRSSIGMEGMPVESAWAAAHAGLLPAIITFFLGCLFFTFHKRRFADEV